MAGEHQKSLVAHLRKSGRHELAGKLEKLAPHHFDAYLHDFVKTHGVTRDNVDQKLADARARVAAKKGLKEGTPDPFSGVTVLTGQGRKQLKNILKPKIKKTAPDIEGDGHAIQEISSDLARRYFSKAGKEHQKLRHGEPTAKGDYVPFSSELSKTRGTPEHSGVARKTRNRKKGLDRALDRIDRNEELELQELSRDTLVSYIHKGAGDMAQQGVNFNQAHHNIDKKTMAKIRNKVAKRRHGMTNAAARLAYSGGHMPKQTIQIKENTQIDELSAVTLSRYLVKATDDKDHKELEAATAPLKTIKNRAKASAGKRARGIRTAFDKWIMQKEDAQLDEISTGLVKRYAGVAKHNLQGHSHAWDSLAREPSFSKSQQKAFDHHDKQAEKRYKGIKSARKRGIDAWKEELEEALDMTKIIRHPTEKRAYVKTIAPSADGDGQIGYKSSNKHGKLKFWNSLGALSALKHAGLHKENLQELSHGTLKNYIWHRGQYDVAHNSLVKKAQIRTGKKEISDAEFSKQHAIGAAARQKGRKLARDKMTRSGTSAGAPPLHKAASLLARASGMREDTELQELSKDTLLNYAQKANNQVFKRQRFFSDIEAAQKQSKKIKNRHAGVHLALKKLAKEDIGLQELSKNTLRSYVDKASDEMPHREKKMREFPGDNEMDPFKKVQNRYRGISKASSKLREGVDLVEISRNTLVRYINRAEKNKHDNEDKGDALVGSGRRDKRTMNRIDQHYNKAAKRHYGIEQAVKHKNYEEQTELDEIAQVRLTKYVGQGTSMKSRALSQWKNAYRAKTTARHAARLVKPTNSRLGVPRLQPKF